MLTGSLGNASSPTRNLTPTEDHQRRVQLQHVMERLAVAPVAIKETEEAKVFGGIFDDQEVLVERSDARGQAFARYEPKRIEFQKRLRIQLLAVNVDLKENMRSTS